MTPQQLQHLRDTGHGWAADEIERLCSRVSNKGVRPLSRDDVLDLLPVVQDGWSATDYGEWVARAIERAHGIVGHNA